MQLTIPILYQVLFSEEASCLSPEGQNIVKEYEDWYMTPVEVYIRIFSSTKPLHWLPHLAPNSLLLQEKSYQKYVNGVVASLQRNKKGLWPQFPLIKPICKIKNSKWAKEEFSLLAFYQFKEVTLEDMILKGKLKEHLQQVGFIWSYSHEYLLPRELNQQ